MKLKLRVTRKEWWASLAASTSEERRGTQAQTDRVRLGEPDTGRERGRGYKLSWDKGKCDNCEQFLVSQGEAIWTNCDRKAICSNNGDRGRDSILDLRSTEVGVWHQQEHNMPRGESHSVSRRYLWGRMGWEYAKMFPWLISDHVHSHCVSSYAQIRIVISKGKKV